MRTIVFFVPIFLLISVSCSRNDTVQPQRKEITDAVFASGNIVDEDQYLVIAATEAYLDKSLVKEGDTVKAGAMLFLLSNEIQSAQFESARTNYNDAKVRNDVNSPQLQELKLQIEQGKAQVMNDERNFNRYANLVKTGAVSKAEYDKVKLQYDASQSNLAILGKSFGDMKLGLELKERNASDQLKIQQRNNKDYLVAANYNGIVLSVEKNQGEFLRRGETIAKIGAGNRMVKLSIAEEDISRIKLNDKVVVSLNTDTQKNYLARITKIYPSFDTKEQAFIAEAIFRIFLLTLCTTHSFRRILLLQKRQMP